MALVVRPARAEDERALRAIDLRSWPLGSYVVPPREGPFFTDRTRVADVVVAEVDGAVAGYVKIVQTIPFDAHAHVLEIQGIAVAPERRGQGVGRALLEAAAAHAREAGARKLALRVLSSNPGARALYLSSGFEVEGVLREEFRLEDGRYVDDLVMGRRL